MLKSLLQFDDRSPLTPIGSFPKALRGSRVLPPKPLARALTRRRQMPGFRRQSRIQLKDSRALFTQQDQYNEPNTHTPVKLEEVTSVSLSH